MNPGLNMDTLRETCLWKYLHIIKFQCIKTTKITRKFQLDLNARSILPHKSLTYQIKLQNPNLVGHTTGVSLCRCRRRDIFNNVLPASEISNFCSNFVLVHVHIPKKKKIKISFLMIWYTAGIRSIFMSQTWACFRKRKESWDLKMNFRRQLHILLLLYSRFKR